MTIKTAAWKDVQFDFVYGTIGWGMVFNGDGAALVYTPDAGAI